MGVLYLFRSEHMKKSFSKRITALLLIVAMSLCCFITSVSASEVVFPSEAKLSVSADNTVYSEGSTVTVTVSLSGSKAVDAIGLEFKFDDSRLEIVSGEWNTDLGDVAIATDNFSVENATKHHAGLAVTSGTVSPNGEIFKATLKVKADADTIEAADAAVEVVPTLKISDTKYDCESASVSFAIHNFGDWTGSTEAGDLGLKRTCSVCGKVQKQYISEELKFAGYTVTFSGNLQVNFAIDKSVFDKYGNLYAEFQLGGKAVNVEEYRIDSDDNVWFTLNGVLPQMMTDDIRAGLYGVRKTDGEQCVYQVATTIRNYAEWYFNAYKTNIENDKMYALLVNMLNYGAKAQLYANYRTDDLADKNLNDAQKKLITSERRYLNSLSKATIADESMRAVAWQGATLSLTDPVALMFVVKAESLEGLTLKASCNQGSWNIPLTVDGKSVIDNHDGTFNIYFDKLHAALMSEVVRFTFVDSRLQAVSDTLSYGIESYVAYGFADYPGWTALVTAMMQYGDAARRYALDGEWGEWKPVS